MGGSTFTAASSHPWDKLARFPLPAPPSHHRAATPLSGPGVLPAWLPGALPAGSLLSPLQISPHQPRLFFPRCLFGKEFSRVLLTHTLAALPGSQGSGHARWPPAICGQRVETAALAGAVRTALEAAGRVPATWSLDKYLGRTCSVPGAALVTDGPAWPGLSVQASVKSQALCLMGQTAGCSSQGCPWHPWVPCLSFPRLKEEVLHPRAVGIRPWVLREAGCSCLWPSPARPSRWPGGSPVPEEHTRFPSWRDADESDFN